MKTNRRNVVVVATGKASGELAAALENLAFVVNQADRVHEGARLPDAQTAAVLTEVALPDGNWRDLVEQLQLRGVDVPVVLCTDAGTAELWWDALECGVSEVASPPYTAKGLQQILTTIGGS